MEPEDNKTTKNQKRRPNTSELLPLKEYDHILVSFSGGKDSLAATLKAIEDGAPLDRIELWHQSVDGRPGSESFMDWPVTEAYCKAIAKHLRILLRFQWKDGGFKGELLRENAKTRTTTFQLGDGSEKTVGGIRGKDATRRKFPQKGADMKTRWCSGYLKIDPCATAINNDPRFKGKKVLLITGERREESANRARYAEVERHKSTNSTRRVDQWRAVIDWTETQVWDTIKRRGIQPHPAYLLGWGRVSCMTCIFGDKNQWASVRELAPAAFGVIADFEKEFSKTIDHKKTVGEMADAGQEFVTDKPRELRDQAMSQTYDPNKVTVPEGQKWEMPVGAYKHGCGGPS